MNQLDFRVTDNSYDETKYGQKSTFGAILSHDNITWW